MKAAKEGWWQGVCDLALGPQQVAVGHGLKDILTMADGAPFVELNQEEEASAPLLSQKSV